MTNCSIPQHGLNHDQLFGSSARFPNHTKIRCSLPFLRGNIALILSQFKSHIKELQILQWTITLRYNMTKSMSRRARYSKCSGCNSKVVLLILLTRLRHQCCVLNLYFMFSHKPSDRPRVLYSPWAEITLRRTHLEVNTIDIGRMLLLQYRHSFYR